MLKLSQVAPHEWEFVYPDIYDDLRTSSTEGASFVKKAI